MINTYKNKISCKIIIKQKPKRILNTRRELYTNKRFELFRFIEIKKSGERKIFIGFIVVLSKTVIHSLINVWWGLLTIKIIILRS